MNEFFFENSVFPAKKKRVSKKNNKNMDLKSQAKGCGDATCRDKSEPTLCCGGCQQVWYHSLTCQTNHWHACHGVACRKLAMKRKTKSMKKTQKALQKVPAFRIPHVLSTPDNQTLVSFLEVYAKTKKIWVFEEDEEPWDAWVEDLVDPDLFPYTRPFHVKKGITLSPSQSCVLEMMLEDEIYMFVHGEGFGNGINDFYPSEMRGKRSDPAQNVIEKKSNDRQASYIAQCEAKFGVYQEDDWTGEQQHEFLKGLLETPSLSPATQLELETAWVPSIFQINPKTLTQSRLLSGINGDPPCTDLKCKTLIERTFDALLPALWNVMGDTEKMLLTGKNPRNLSVVIKAQRFHLPPDQQIVDKLRLDTYTQNVQAIGMSFCQVGAALEGKCQLQLQSEHFGEKYQSRQSLRCEPIYAQPFTLDVPLVQNEGIVFNAKIPHGFKNLVHPGVDPSSPHTPLKTVHCTILTFYVQHTQKYDGVLSPRGNPYIHMNTNVMAWCCYLQECMSFKISMDACRDILGYVCEEKVGGMQQPVYKESKKVGYDKEYDPMFYVPLQYGPLTLTQAHAKRKALQDARDAVVSGWMKTFDDHSCLVPNVDDMSLATLMYDAMESAFIEWKQGKSQNIFQNKVCIFF